MRLVAIDFETTGTVKGFPNEPWQLGMITLQDGVIIPDTQWETLFHVGARPFSPRAVGRYAEMREQLAAAPEPMDMWNEISGRLFGAGLIAHNAVAEKTQLSQLAPLAPFGPWVDTLKITRKFWPDMESYALGDLIEGFGIKDRLDVLCPGRTWHDALYDACAAAVLFCHICKTLNIKDEELIS